MKDQDLDQLETRLPEGRILRGEEDRSARSRDWWPLARLREVRGDDPPRPAAVLLPRSTAEVSTMLAWATETSSTVVPRGLGSGVLGAVVPDATSVVMDLSHLDRILDIDERSSLVSVEAGIRGSKLEDRLNDRGLTMGHLPQSLALSSPGGWIAAWGAGQASPAYGAIEDRLVGLTAVLVDGTVVTVKPMPRAAAGIDLRYLFLGAEGSLAVVTAVDLALAPLESETAWAVFKLPGFDACLDAARAVRHAGVHPSFLRGWDEPDSMRAFGLSQGHSEGAVFLVGLGAQAPGRDERLARVAEVATDLGGVPLDATYGEHWWLHRLDAVEAFERAMGPQRSLGVGSVLDTMEVTGLWRDLAGVHRAVSGALAADADDVGCHFSHVYATGAALYFTFVLRADDDDQAEARYLEMWDRALSACISAGGRIAHHHGVGRLKSDHLATDLGPGAMELLSRVKAALDPQGLLNPGVGLSRVSDAARDDDALAGEI